MNEVTDNPNEQPDILVERDGSVATVTFNRPTQRNAISYAGWLELQRIAIELERDNSVRVVVFTGAGDRAFSAGADIKDFEQYRINSQIAKVYADAFDGAMDTVEAMTKPTISMIRGFCVGGGCEFSMATDIRIASDDSRFGIPIARLGILVGYGEMRRLVNLVGPGNASYILLSGRLIDAHEAHRIGLITTLLTADELHERTYALAHEMAARATQPEPTSASCTPCETRRANGTQESKTCLHQLRQRRLPRGRPASSSAATIQQANTSESIPPRNFISLIPRRRNPGKVGRRD